MLVFCQTQMSKQKPSSVEPGNFKWIYLKNLGFHQLKISGLNALDKVKEKPKILCEFIHI